jgi:N-acetylglucosamine repressor
LPLKAKKRLISSIELIINEIINNQKIEKNKIFGIGLSISGIIDSYSGKAIFCPNIFGWENLPIRKIHSGHYRI